MEIIWTILLVGVMGLLVFQSFFQTKPEETTDRELLRKLEEERNRLLEEKARLEAEKDQKIAENSSLVAKLEQAEKEKNEFSGANKRLILQHKDFEGENRILKQEGQELKKQLAKFEAEKAQKETEQSALIQKLENAQKSLDDERNRIRREDEAEQEQILAEKNRQWAEHEKIVIARIRETCQRPEIGFNFFENTNLPSEFDGNFKPDGLVEFLGQYIYFDAKLSDQKDPNAYFSLKKLSEISKKCKNYKVYPTVFFVVPENRISEIRDFSLQESGFNFFIISPSAIAPILANFRKISDYENLEKFDPEDREKIVNLIANYDRHISFQNAVNILSAQKMVDLMDSKEELPSDFQEEISVKKSKMSDLKFMPSAVKKLSGSFENQRQEITKMTEAKTLIEEKEQQKAQNLLDF